MSNEDENDVRKPDWNQNLYAKYDKKGLKQRAEEAKEEAEGSGCGLFLAVALGWGLSVAYLMRGLFT